MLMPDPGSVVAFAEGVKKTNPTSKLELNRHTLRPLSETRLRNAFGGNAGADPEDPWGNEGETGPNQAKSRNICVTSLITYC
jgi:hypothetical protein